MIYLITDGTNLKVGYTSNLERRMSQYNTHSSTIKLINAKPGNFKSEKNIHKKFSHIKINREWFKYSEDLISYFNSYNGDRDLFIESLTDSKFVYINPSQLMLLRSRNSIGVLLVVIEELFGFSNSTYVFTALMDDKSRWAEKLGIHCNTSIDNALAELVEKDMIYRVSKGKYAINQKYVFAGALKDRPKYVELNVQYKLNN